MKTLLGLFFLQVSYVCVCVYILLVFLIWLIIFEIFFDLIEINTFYMYIKTSFLV
jgi:hypothetical protein